MTKNSVCLIGADGNMGRRYKAILNEINIKFCSVDIGDRWPDSAHHYIIATPTDTHLEMIAKINEPDARILVEKPLCRLSSMLRIQTVRDACKDHTDKLFMVNQYAYIPWVEKGIGPTIYDYYNTGRDGLGWDCIQLIHLAKGYLSLRNKSPIWQCTINGLPITRGMVDRAYIEMIRDFLSDGELHQKLWGWDDITKAIERALRWEKDTDRRTGEEYINSAAR